MIKKIVKLLFILWQSRQGGHAYGKSWKYKKRKAYKHDRRWAQDG